MGTANKTRKHTQGGQMLSKITKLICAGVIIKLNGFLLGCKGPEFVEDEDGNLLGIKLHLPQELIADCEYKRWQFINLEKKSVLEERFSTEENFHAWCDKQETKYPYGIHCTYAYILKKANEKNYLISWDFCSKMDIGAIIITIYYKGATHCMKGLYPHTPGGRYLKNFGFGS